MLVFACVLHFFMIKRYVLSEENYEARQRLEGLRAIKPLVRWRSLNFSSF
jgi:hypothetical protein